MKIGTMKHRCRTSIAQEVEGVNFAEKNNSGNRVSRTAHDNPTLGFQKANDLGNVGAWHSNSVNQFLRTRKLHLLERG